jgi:hypothetical protein
MAGTYMGEPGGLYPGGLNVPPIAHDSAGRAIAASVVALDTLGVPDPAGAWVLLSVGMSNCTQEFSRFIQDVTGDTTLHPNLRIVDGAQGGQTAARIQYDTANFWRVIETRLRNVGLSPAQVQAIWLKEADAGPNDPFPGHAITLRDELRNIAQLVKTKYPNLRQVYLSSRIYAGYASTTLNPEPYAYETGFAVRWLIEAQIDGNDSLNYDPGSGDIKAPWLAWGPYLYADGVIPRDGDSLQWFCSDFSQDDGTHPATTGRAKVASMLESFFTTSPYTTPWFLKSDSPACACDCHADPACDAVKSDILDVVNTINVAFRGTPGTTSGVCPYQDTDVDCTTATDILDVVKVVNVAFRGADANTEYCSPCAP